MPDLALSVSSIAARIHALSLNWLAKDNELTALSDAERHLRLGAIPPAGKTLAERSRRHRFMPLPPEAIQQRMTPAAPVGLPRSRTRVVAVHASLSEPPRRWSRRCVLPTTTRTRPSTS